jgi:hypothetical protein
MISDQLPDFGLICIGFLEHFWVGSRNGARGKNPKQRFTELQEVALVSARRTEMSMEVKGPLGFYKSHRYIPTRAIWVSMVHITSLEITE